MVVQVRRTERSLELDLTGEWRALQFAQIDAALAAIDLAGTRRLVISTEQLAALDLSGAWRLREFLKRARDAGAEVAFRGTPPDQLRLIDEALQGAGAPAGTSGQGAGGPGLPAVTFICRGTVLFGEGPFLGLAFL